MDTHRARRKYPEIHGGIYSYLLDYVYEDVSLAWRRWAGKFVGKEIVEQNIEANVNDAIEPLTLTRLILE